MQEATLQLAPAKMQPLEATMKAISRKLRLLSSKRMRSSISLKNLSLSSPSQTPTAAIGTDRSQEMSLLNRAIGRDQSTNLGRWTSNLVPALSFVSHVASGRYV